MAELIEFLDIEDANPTLALSPIVRGLEKTFAYLGEHGSIGLTPSKVFKRVFVHWAAREFEWPGHTEVDLFTVNKVLNEMDFGPPMDLHDVMIALKIGRHYNGEFKLSKAGQELVGHTGRSSASSRRSTCSRSTTPASRALMTSRPSTTGTSS
jgi:hypothetical protein